MMKRPFCILTLMVLSGMLCGLWETDPVFKCAALAGAFYLGFSLCRLSFIRFGGRPPFDRPLFVHAIAAYLSFLRKSFHLFSRHTHSIHLTASTKHIFKKHGSVFAAVFPALLLSVFLFFCGFLRAYTVSAAYDTPDTEAEAFFCQYAPRNPGAFDYGLYLKSLGIDSEEKRQESAVPPFLSRFSSICAETFAQYMTPKDAGIYDALLLGDKKAMDPDTKALFQAAGISHILAVSGLHISLLGMGFFQLLRRFSCPLGLSSLCAALLSLSYGFLTGTSASAMRAVFMLLLRFLALCTGRSFDMRTALAAAALPLALLHPYLLLSSGFLLSFGAILAICVFGEALTQALSRQNQTAAHEGAHKNIPTDTPAIAPANPPLLPNWKKTLLQSFSIQFFTLPILLWNFYAFPLYSFLLNMIVIPLMVCVVLSGLLLLFAAGFSNLCTALTGIRLPALFCILPGALGHFILRLYEFLCRFTNRLPLHTLVFGQPSAWQVLLFYLLLYASFRHCFYQNKDRRQIRRPARRFFLLCFLLPLVFLKPVPARLTITAIDVGQGDGFLLRDKGRTILIDSGSNSEKELEARTLKPFLLSQGISHIDLAFVSHADNDHVSGLLDLMRDEVSPVRIDTLILPRAAKEHSAYTALKETFASFSKTGQLLYLEEGDAFTVDSKERLIYTPASAKAKLGNASSSSPELRIRCLYAGNTAEPDNINANSPIMLLSFGQFSMLFTGDTTKEDEAELYRRLSSLNASVNDKKTPSFSGDLQLEHALSDGVTIYKAAHHGSKTSNSDAILKLFRPRYALISCAEKNRYGHPSPPVLARFARYGVRVLETRKSGAIRIETDGKRLWMDSFLSGSLNPP